MKFRAQLLILSALTYLALSAPQCSAQSILNQSSDDLLKDFNVDPNQVAAQYQPKPVSKTERFLQMFGGTMNKSNAGSNSGTNYGTGFGTNNGTNNGTNTGPNTAYNTGPYGTTSGPKSGDRGTLRVRAPFLKLDMINGERCIRVDAPFLNYDSNPAMSENIRNQEASAAALPPSMSPAPVSVPPAAISAPALESQSNLQSDSAKPARLRLERSTAQPLNKPATLPQHPTRAIKPEAN